MIGGSGFIGTNLIRDLLGAGHIVSNMDIRESALFPVHTKIGDVRDLEAVCRLSEGVDVIVNLAAEHRDDVKPVSRYYDVNVEGARQVVAAANLNGIRRIVFTSSVALYGLSAQNPSEMEAPRPFNDYGQSKWDAEQVYNAWFSAHSDATLVIVRPCVVFGEGNCGNVYTLLNQIRSGRFVSIGSGTNKKSMAYVRNISRFLASCLLLDQGQYLFNYADKPDLSTNEIVEVACRSFGKGMPVHIPLILGLAAGHIFDFVARATGRTFPISAVRVHKFISDTRVATDRIEEIGWKPCFSLDEALRRTIQHEFDDASH